MTAEIVKFPDSEDEELSDIEFMDMIQEMVLKRFATIILYAGNEDYYLSRLQIEHAQFASFIGAKLLYKSVSKDDE